MSTFIVHSMPGSPYGRSVLATLEEKGVAYRLLPIAVGAHRAEPHLSRHPFGRIPVLEHDGFMLYETQAILRYLDRVLPSPALMPADPKAAARTDQIMNINDWYLYQGVANVIVAQRVIFPRLFGQAPDEAAIAAAMPKAHAVFDELARLLGNNKYFGGDMVSLADLSVAPQMDLFAGLPEWLPLTNAHTNLREYLDRMNARASFEATTWERVAQLATAA